MSWTTPIRAIEQVEYRLTGPQESVPVVGETVDVDASRATMDGD